MAIYLTGDLHGNIQRLRARSFREHGPGQGDYLIVLGDFGLVWHFPNSRWFGEQQEDIAWLDSQPYTTLFIDGNHENFSLLNDLPIERWHGGKVHFVAPNVIHLMRGQVFDIEGKTFFAFGGATSVDRAYRVEGESWWADEVPTAEEVKEGLSNLWANGMRVDYMLTHCAPSALLSVLGHYAGMAFEADPVTEILDFYYKNAQFKAWLFGHYHFDVACGRYFCLLNNVVHLDKLPLTGALMEGFSPLWVGKEAWPVDIWLQRANAIADERSSSCAKNSPYRRGLTAQEIAEITDCPENRVETAAVQALCGSTCGVGVGGERIYYWSDLMRLFRELA